MSRILSVACLLISLSALQVFAAARPPTPVFVVELEMQSFIEEIEALGTLKARENVVLTSSVTERIVAVNFEDGARVSRGDVLVEMDAAEEKARLEGERSVLAEAKREVERLGPLKKSGVTSQASMDQARRDLLTAQARVEAIQSQIAERIIVAPFDGKVGLRNISIGAMSQPGTVITTIDDDSRMKIDFAVPDLFLNELQIGRTILARAKVYPDEIFEGRVVSVDSRVNPETRSIVVRAMVDNPERKLRPGMLMGVTLQKPARDTLVVPEASLVSKGDRNYVYRIETEADALVAKLVLVKQGVRHDGVVEIIEGLSVGDRVVNHGTVRLRDGAPVVVKAVGKGDESLSELLQKSKQSSKGNGKEN